MLGQHFKPSEENHVNAAQTTTATGLDAVWYLVKDLRKARDFYEALLGVRPATEGEHWIEYELPDGNAFGIAYDPQGFWTQCGGAMFAFPDFENAVERAKELRAVLHTQMETPVCHTAWCADADGNTFAIHRRKS